MGDVTILPTIGPSGQRLVPWVTVRSTGGSVSWTGSRFGSAPLSHISTPTTTSSWLRLQQTVR
jgi:hypothetical protein